MAYGGRGQPSGLIRLIVQGDGDPGLAAGDGQTEAGDRPPHAKRGTAGFPCVEETRLAGLGTELRIAQATTHGSMDRKVELCAMTETEEGGHRGMIRQIRLEVWCARPLQAGIVVQVHDVEVEHLVAMSQQERGELLATQPTALVTRILLTTTLHCAQSTTADQSSANSTQRKLGGQLMTGHDASMPPVCRVHTPKFYLDDECAALRLKWAGVYNRHGRLGGAMRGFRPYERIYAEIWSLNNREY